MSKMNSCKCPVTRGGVVHAEGCLNGRKFSKDICRGKVFGLEAHEDEHSGECKLAMISCSFFPELLAEVDLIPTGEFERLRSENEKLKEVLDTIRNWAQVQLDEDMIECRGDEDCDHCLGLGLLHDIKQAREELGE